MNKHSKTGNTLVVGVDIHPHVIRMVKVLRTEAKRPRILAWRTHSLAQPLQTENESYSRILAEELQSFLEDASVFEVWTTLQAQQVRTFHLQLPKMDSKQLGAAVFWAVKRENPFEESEWVLDYEVVTSGDEEKAPVTHITAYLASRQHLDQTRDLFNQAGFPLSGISLPMSAFNNFIRSGWIDAEPAPVAVSITDMDATQVGLSHLGFTALTRNIPAGLNQMSEAADKALVDAPLNREIMDWISGVSDEASDAGQSGAITDKYYIDALRRPLERLARHVEQTIEFFHRNHKTPGSVDTVYTFGLVATNKAIRDYLNQRLDVDIIPFDPMAPAFIAEDSQVPEKAEERIPYNLALGLALSAPDQTINFLHTFKDRQTAQRHQLIGRITLISTAAVLAISAVCGFWQYQILAGFKTERKALEQTVSGFDPRVSETVLRDTATELQQRQRELKAAAERHQASALIVEISNLVPAGIVLTEISFGQPRAQSRNRSQSADGSIRIQGLIERTDQATDSVLALYTSSLRSSPLITQVDIDEELRNAERRSETHNYFTIRIVPTTGFMPSSG
ncbi:MAG: pilus assembly protein PilM [Opitutales bacterium]|nr:pilus assembly protein PilM [Opitutales bacterium]